MQCNDDMASVDGNGFLGLKLIIRLEDYSNGINGHVTVTKVIFQV